MPQYSVALLVKGWAINGGLRLVLGHLWASDMYHLYVTPHYILRECQANKDRFRKQKKLHVKQVARSVTLQSSLPVHTIFCIVQL